MTQAPALDHPGVIAPPPLIFAAVLATGVALDWSVGGLGSAFPPAVHYTLGALLLVAAAMFLGGALGRFHRAGTRPEPWQPTSAIVVGGIYALTRNPMYVGMALAYLGIAFLLDRPLAMALLPVALLLIHYGVVLREERYLEAKFGEPYRRYKASVPRWL